MNKGFTLIELLVVIFIMALLSSIILFSVTQYLNKGKDSNIAGNLAILVPAGEVFYNGNGGDGYKHFCDPDINSVLKNALEQMPENPNGSCYNALANPAGVCCHVNGAGDKWSACAREFSGAGEKAFCVDSRGIKKRIESGSCSNTRDQCP